MAKISKTYLEPSPYKIIESGFHKEHAKVSESIFSLANEYSGVRGYFEETYTGDSLRGSYFNGIYEYAKEDTPNAYKGIVKRTHFTINSTDYLKCEIKANKEILDLNKVSFSNFSRELDMLSGLYTRQFVWNHHDANIKMTFKRLLSMENPIDALQQITFLSDRDITLDIKMILTINVLHWQADCYFKRNEEFKNKDVYGVIANTLTTKQTVCSAFTLDGNIERKHTSFKDKEVIVSFKLNLKANKEETITRYVSNLIDKKHIVNLKDKTINSVKLLKEKGFDKVLAENTSFFKNVYDKQDIEIDGDIYNQQGIRFCIFQLACTYHGFKQDNNIGAKGLTGEAYSGHAFWDSETYCLPFYLFSNKEASKNLLMFRYNTLKEAKERALDLDCEGACFPIATRNGKEGCNLWQHASLQLQPSTAVVYAIFHYMNLYNDTKFMQQYGLEMILEVTKFLLSRGQYNQDHTKFSYYGVMGPDEFQMMVNHNTYTNFMAKKTFEYLLSLINSGKYDVEKVFKKTGFSREHLDKLKDANDKMVILYDKNTKLFEQHDGFFDLPHIDVDKIPNEEFPLYSHWTYDRIYRNDMIKQPDVLMFMFLYNQDFTLEEKKANYEYYEPRCIHESSLSPSIHSIFATEIGKQKEAYEFFRFATRLDLDNYNNNTGEGIHTTSIAAAWMNIVYGFGGLRSDKEILKIAPVSVDKWNYYSFKIMYHDTKISVKVDKKNVYINVEGKPVTLKIYDEVYNIKDNLTIRCING